MYADRHSNPWIRLRHVLRVFLTLLGSGLTQQLLGVLGHSAPLLGPEVMSLGELPQLTLLYHPPLHSAVLRQVGLPAPQGTDFEGPDPGLNAAIISAPEVCPNNYMRDSGGRCRPAFSYGPNPLSTFSPEKFKGSIQFYMGLHIGRPMQVGRRRPFPRQRNGNRRGGRFHLPLSSTIAPIPSTTAPPLPLDEEQISANHVLALDSLLPTPPPLTEAVAEITAILAAFHKNNPSSGDTQPKDDDDD